MSLNLGIIASSRTTASGVADPIALYSFRKIRSAYSGSAIRVRRSSDNAEQDIGFVGGNFDTASLATFAGYQNLSKYSEDYSNVYWTKNGGSITINSSLAPDGTTTANKFAETSGNEVHRIYEQPPYVTGYVFTYSVYLKYIGRRYVMLELSNSTGMQVIFDIQNGLVSASAGAVSPISTSIQSAGNGWYRCSVTFQNASGTTLIISGNNSGSISDLVYTGLGGDAFYIWGSQMNVGSIPQTYQKVTSAINVQYISKWYDQSGNLNDAIMATTANQPQVLIAPEANVTVASWHGSSNYLNTSAFTMGTNISTFWLGKRINGSANGTFFGDNNANFDCRVDLVQIQTGGVNVGSFGTAFNSWAIGSLLRKSASSKAYINNAQSGATNTTVLTSAGTRSVSIGKRGLDTAVNLQGWIREIMIYNSDQSTNLSTINTGISTYYSIYWQGTGSALLDLYPSSAAAYSLRNLSSTYTGPLVRVRRSSDSTEQDIYGTFAGQLDTNTLLAFCGTGNGFVSTWYDQSGNGRNVTQSTATYQPQIVASGVVYLFGTKPSLYFTADALSNSTFTLTQPNTYFIVTEGTSTNSTGDRNIFDGTGANRNAIGKSNGNSNYFLYAGSLVYSSTPVNNNKSLFVPIFNSATSFLYLNNSEILSNANPGTQSLQGLRIGGFTDLQAMWESFIPEFIVYNSNKSTDRIAIQNNINSFYSIFWQGTGNALLDLYPSAAAAYSLRNLSSTYLGPLIRVRRSSDNAEKDIYGTYTGILDTTSLLAFVGSGSGFVSIWYDQSGNGRNAIQTTSGNQPYIITLGTLNLSNSKPAIFFTSNEADKLTTSGIISGSAQRTQVAVYQPSAVSPSSSGIFGQGFNAATGAWSYIQSRTTAGATGDPYFAGFSADLGNGLSTRNTLLKIGSFMYNGSTGYLWKNNTQLTSGNLTLNTQINDVTQIGCSGGGTGTSGEFHNGSISECILYTSNQLSNIEAINSNINSHYLIY